MNKIGLVGNQIKYSLSPKIHEFFARESRVAIDYQVIDCEAGEFAKAVNDFFKDSSAVGLNVTIPYKEKALNMPHQQIFKPKNVTLATRCTKMETPLKPIQRMAKVFLSQLKSMLI